MVTIKESFPTPTEYTVGKNTCEYIIVHGTGTKPGTIQGVLNGLNKRLDYASCHYCVDVNGDIYKIGEDTDILWHAGTSKWGDKTDMNKYSIGIEVIGIDSFTDEQRKSIKELVEALMLEHNIPKENVLRHAQIAPGRKTDINLNFILPLTKWEDWQNTLTPVPEWAIQLVKDFKEAGVSTSPTTKVGDMPLYQLWGIVKKLIASH